MYSSSKNSPGATLSELQKKYGINTVSSTAKAGSNFSNGWVSETVNWSTDGNSNKQSRRKKVGSPNALSPYSSQSSASTWAKSSKDSPVSAFGGTYRNTGKNNSKKPVQRPARPPPATPDLSKTTSRNPRAKPRQPLQPKKQQQASPTLSRTSTSSTSSKRSNRSRKSAEYNQNRRELDELMSKVLTLQDQGKFSEVGPLMKRIEQLQKNIESRFEEDHLAATGEPPKKQPEPKKTRKVKISENAVAAAQPDLDVAPSPIAPVPILKQPTESAPADVKAKAKSGGVFAKKKPEPAEREESSEDNEDDDMDTSSSESEPAPVRKHITGSKPQIPGGRKPRTRRLSLSRQVSDVLLLVGGEEEEEIITTLRNQNTSQSAKGSEGENGPKSVFAQRTSTGAKTKKKKTAQKERHMLTMEGIMRKSPPEFKRFSRWHDRYFTLAGPLLSYRKYVKKKSKKGGEAQIKRISNVSRIIDLKGAAAELVTLESSGSSKTSTKGLYEIRLQAEKSGRVYRLRLRSKRLALEWFVAIKNNIVVANKEGDVARLEKRRREKKREKEAKNQPWKPPEEDSRVGQDICAPVENEDIFTMYSVLGVGPSATAKMIKTKYRDLAREYHPDKNVGVDISRFAEIARAFDVLESPQSRARYDMCERVKKKFREGVVCKMHDMETGEIEKVAMMMDPEFKCLYWQEESFGSVLQPDYKYVHLRFVQEILAGSDGFDCPPGQADCCLSLIGVRLGCTIGVHKLCKINLQFQSKRARDEVLDGLRILRCRFSELFKQRLDEIKAEGLR